MTDDPRRDLERAEPTELGIGVDQWVAQSDERRAELPGLRGRIARGWSRLPPAGKLALLTPAILVPFLPISSGNLYNYGLFILIYALLALGLNVVVGFAGLLDLGYVAFFGFGAYIYAFLSGTHEAGGHVYTHHWGAEASIPLVVAVCALLGLFLGTSSRRLLGDYLAIVTLFFGQAFVVFTNTANPAGITNGSNGLANVDPLTFFGGRIVIDTTRGYFWFLLGVVAIVLVVLYCLSESRTGRAWKASREDPLSAELMGMPVNRLKIMAFSFGAGIAGLAGSIFAAVQTGAFPQNFGTAVLILIYAVVILGGAGSLTGMIVGSIVIVAANQALDPTSPANLPRILFYGAVIAAVYLTMKTWPKRIAALAGTAVFGLLVHAIVGSVWSDGTSGQVTSGGFLGGVIKNWVLIPEHPSRLAVYGYSDADRLRHGARTTQGLVADRCARPDAVPDRVRVGEPDDPTALGHAPGAPRADADRGDDHPPSGTVWSDQGRDRLMARMLELKGVSKAFGGLNVISGLDFHVDEHEIVSVIGPNGAGKTTLFNIVTGVYQPDKGDVLFEGESIVGLAPYKITQRGMARTFQTLRLFLNMTVKENVMAAEYGHTRAGVVRSILRTPGMRREEREISALAEEKLAFFGQRLMGYRWNQPAYSLSYANRRRLEIARALATNARLLLLDEPAAGMNPVETHEITEQIARLRDDLGLTIFVIEHDMHLVEGISDRVVALDHGVKIEEGTFDEVATSPRVIEAYLGLRAGAEEAAS